MRKHSATKWLITGLLLLTFVQTLWILNEDPKPVLSKVVSLTPIGNYGAVYEVLSDAGGATVPLTYLYFVAERVGQDDQVLPSLEQLTPFLVTRQAGAVDHVEGLKVVARTQEQVYSYSSTAFLRENGAVLPVSIELTATTHAK